MTVGTRQGPPPALRAWLALSWLVFLLDPLVAAWHERDQIRGVVGLVATLGFAAVYSSLWLSSPQIRRAHVLQPPRRFVVPILCGLIVLGLAMVLTIGQQGTAAAVYIAVGIVLCLPIRPAMVAVGVLAVAVGLSGQLPGWHSQVGTAFGVLAAALAIFGFRTVLARNVELGRAHEENTRLAVENERNRFARDLHDILGHSLTVITVKAELAGRLLDAPGEQGVVRARDEVADLERLARDALSDVRRAVTGYRELTLPGELAKARGALASAEIEVVVLGQVDQVPAELRDLFAWTVREAVTNVIRHSGARRCEIVVAADGLEVRDDGHGADPSAADGSGLRGLRERASAAGAVATTSSTPSGFTVSVKVR